MRHAHSLKMVIIMVFPVPGYHFYPFHTWLMTMSTSFHSLSSINSFSFTTSVLSLLDFCGLYLVILGCTTLFISGYTVDESVHIRIK